MKILLLSTYELGRQPFGLASPAAWLRKRGHHLRCFDLSRQSLDESVLREAQLIVFYLPMHTATRLALQWTKIIRSQNPSAHLCACGLYADLNESHLRAAGFSSVLGPEFEHDLAELADSLLAGLAWHGAGNGNQKLPRLAFQAPDRSGLPALRKYAHVVLPDGKQRTAGYTEASRGCKHLCRHCPVVPVYSGQFRVVPVDVVLSDIRQQAAMGAEHITFGDPDFFNGVTHARRIVEVLHAEFPRLTYDATIKIEHLLRHAEALPVLARTGCLFVTSAVEALDDRVLRRLDKGHTREDFFRALALCQSTGLILQPTFVPFTPWTTRESYLDLLETIADYDLIPAVSPIQLAIRLLIPSRSRLLELPEIATLVGDFDPEKLVYPWRHPDPAFDALADRISAVVVDTEKKRLSRSEIFDQICLVAADHLAAGDLIHTRYDNRLVGAQYCCALPTKKAVNVESKASLPREAQPHPVPFLSEPWYC